MRGVLTQYFEDKVSDYAKAYFEASYAPALDDLSIIPAIVFAFSQ